MMRFGAEVMAVAGGDRILTQAVVHLEEAAVAVDRLWYATGEERPDRAMFSLGEASMAIHQALVALRDWEVTGAGGGEDQLGQVTPTAG